MTPRHPPLCHLCEFFVPGIDPENGRGEPNCIAFPEGIPSQILHGGFDHRQRLDDESITFKRAEDVTEEEVDEWQQIVLETEKAEMLAMVERLHEGRSDWG